MNHIEVLNSLGQDLEKKPEVVALLVFGSVAKGTYHAKSDIDLLLIYKEHTEGFKFDTTMFHCIKIGTSHIDYERYRKGVISKPFTKYVLTTAKIIFDKTEKVQSWIDAISRYLKTNPDIQEEWNRLNKIYEEEKKRYGSGRSNIFEIYRELEQKYEGELYKRLFLNV